MERFCRICPHLPCAFRAHRRNISVARCATDIGYAYGDIIAGLYAALAILASIEFRDRSGSGQYIDFSAYEGLCTLLARPILMLL